MHKNNHTQLCILMTQNRKSKLSKTVQINNMVGYHGSVGYITMEVDTFTQNSSSIKNAYILIHTVLS